MTLKLIKNQQKRIVVSLNELKKEASWEYFLFVFTNEQNGQVVKSFLTDVSPYPVRYNEFIIEIPTTFNLPYFGDYKYEAYEMPDDSDTDETRGNLVEVGKLRYFDVDASGNAYIPSNTTVKSYAKD